MNIATPARRLLQTFFLIFAACVAFSVPQAARAYEDGWRTCADEGQICRVNGRAVVRYGAEGRWTSRSVVNGVACNNDAFGDPAPGDPKRCQVRVSGYDGSGSYRETALGWMESRPKLSTRVPVIVTTSPTLRAAPPASRT